MAIGRAAALALSVSLVVGCCSVQPEEPRVETVYVKVPVAVCPPPQSDLSPPPELVIPDGDGPEWYAEFAGSVRAYIANLRMRLENALAELRAYAEIAEEPDVR